MWKGDVSVVMPVRDGERFLAAAVESVLGQTVKVFQFIIIDDGSTDRTAEMLARYAEQDARIELIQGPGRGIVEALNLGFSKARGKYIARMDADDVSMPQRFEKQKAYLEAHPECVLVGSRVLLMDEDGALIREWCGETTHEEIDAAHMHWGWPVVHPAVMMRREVLGRVGGYRGEYRHIEDLDLFLRLADVGKLANIPEVLLKYRKHFGSICQQKSDEQMHLKLKLYRETYERRGVGGIVVEPRREPVRSWELHKLWGWWALQAGHLGTARKHARLAMREMPLALESWRLMYCAMRGR